MNIDDLIEELAAVRRNCGNVKVLVRSGSGYEPLKFVDTVLVEPLPEEHRCGNDECTEFLDGGDETAVLVD